jgi:hypothetical protein
VGSLLEKHARLDLTLTIHVQSSRSCMQEVGGAPVLSRLYGLDVVVGGWSLEGVAQHITQLSLSPRFLAYVVVTPSQR